MNVPVPINHQPNQFDDSSAMCTIEIIAWILGALVAVGIILMFAKFLLGRRHPPCPPCPRPTPPRPPREESLYTEPMYPLYPGTIGVAPPGPLLRGPPPPRAYDSDLEQGSISERADGTPRARNLGTNLAYHHLRIVGDADIHLLDHAATPQMPRGPPGFAYDAVVFEETHYKLECRLDMSCN